jgi:pimeloyl-ACP methyl ester carboxylesterase
VSSLYRTEAGAQLIAQRYREFLRFWPQPNRQFHVPTRYGETFVVSCGKDDAPPLLLLHGAGSNSAMWIAAALAWSARFKLYAVDVIGEPGFSAESRPPMKSDAFALWLDDLLQGLEDDRFSMIGISLGGWLALDYATRRAARVHRLVLIVPAGIGRQRRSLLFKVLPLLLLGDWGRKKALQIVIGPAPVSSGDDLPVIPGFHGPHARHFRPRMERPAGVGHSRRQRRHSGFGRNQTTAAAPYSVRGNSLPSRTGPWSFRRARDNFAVSLTGLAS